MINRPPDLQEAQDLTALDNREDPRAPSEESSPAPQLPG